MSTTEPAHFERDPNAAAHLAASFGSGAGTAEQLIEANALRYSELYTTASAIAVDPDATGELDRSDVASAAGLEDEYDVLDYACRGRYVTYVAEDPSGRTYKGVLLNDGGSLSAGEDAPDSPAQARVRGAAEAAKVLAEARVEAAKIIEEAQQKAAEQVAKAAQEGQEKQQETIQAAADAEADGEEGSEAGSSPEAEPQAPSSTRQRRSSGSRS